MNYLRVIISKPISFVYVTVGESEEIMIHPCEKKIESQKCNLIEMEMIIFQLTVIYYISTNLKIQTLIFEESKYVFRRIGSSREYSISYIGGVFLSFHFLRGHKYHSNITNWIFTGLRLHWRTRTFKSKKRFFFNLYIYFFIFLSFCQK
jgi:hypothetical protein